MTQAAQHTPTRRQKLHEKALASSVSPCSTMTVMYRVDSPAAGNPRSFRAMPLRCE